MRKLVVSQKDAEGRACRWDVQIEEYFIHLRQYLEEDMSGSKGRYSFTSLQSGSMRLSWRTTIGVRYDEPRVNLKLHLDNNAMALVPRFLEALMDSTLKPQKLLAKH